jgi:hypothetical protein
MAKISIQVVKKDKQSSAAVFSEYVKKARTFGASKVLRKRKDVIISLKKN